MIVKEKFRLFNFIKKDDYTGSMDGMRYLLRKGSVEGEERLEVVTWPEPYNYAKTPEEEKQRNFFSFSEGGLEEAADWLNRQQEQYR